MSAVDDHPELAVALIGAAQEEYKRGTEIATIGKQIAGFAIGLLMAGGNAKADDVRALVEQAIERVLKEQARPQEVPS